jgi:hypothetical protein
MHQKKGRLKICRNFMKCYKILQNTNKSNSLCMAGDMNPRVGNKPINFLLGTNGENTNKLEWKELDRICYRK